MTAAEKNKLIFPIHLVFGNAFSIM